MINCHTEGVIWLAIMELNLLASINKVPKSSGPLRALIWLFVDFLKGNEAHFITGVGYLLGRQHTDDV